MFADSNATNEAVNIFGQQVPVAIALVYIQNWLKSQPWFPFLKTTSSAKLQHLWAAFFALLATIGVHESHTGSVMSGGTITIVMPPLVVFLTGLWHWITQHVITKAMYDGWLKDNLNHKEEKGATKA